MLYSYNMSAVDDNSDDDDVVFKALASPIRRRMLDALKASPRTTGALAALFPELDRTTVLQHLRVLERAELVTGRRVGRERHLQLAPLPIKRIYDRWISEYARAAVDLLDHLDRWDQEDRPGEGDRLDQAGRLSQGESTEPAPSGESRRGRSRPAGDR
jgi:DNA-binding transcriptional ArsR family regulator